MKPKLTDIPDLLAGVKFFEYVSIFNPHKHYDVVIIGHCYAALSAAIVLGRSLRKVLIIDDENSYQQDIITPALQHNSLSLNFSDLKNQLTVYKTVRFLKDKAEKVINNSSYFIIETRRKEKIFCKKLLLATGIKFKLPDIPGFKQCWGTSILPSPYLNGYEFTDTEIGILAHGESAMKLIKEAYNWSRYITLFSDKVLTFTDDQKQKLKAKNIPVEEVPIAIIRHRKGHIEKIILENGKSFHVRTLFYEPLFSQASGIPVKQLGCVLNESGFIKTDNAQRTSVRGVFAAGNSTAFQKSVTISLASGTVAGMSINEELISESFQ